jgi:type VI secretion system protein ImpK
MKLAPSRPIDLLPVAMRDTARTVATLRSDSPPAVADLRRECAAQLAALREELKRRGQPRDVIDDALYAQCALLDETALTGLGPDARDEWEREPLQVRTFARNDAGEELLRRINHRLRESAPVAPLLAIFAAVLELGFMGRFAANGGDARAALVRKIDERLARATANRADKLAPDSSGPIVVNPRRARRPSVSPLAWVLIAALAALLAWFAIDRWLVTSIAGISH